MRSSNDLHGTSSSLLDSQASKPNRTRLVKPYRSLTTLLVLGLLGGSFNMACRSKSSDLREWTPEDHLHGNESSGAAAPEKNDEATVGAVAWAKNCSACHGNEGAGNGPKSSILATPPPNFREPSWQDGRNDAQLKLVIKNGRGAMPAFALPDPVIDKLIKQIRSLRLEPSDAGSPTVSADESTKSP